MNIDEVKELIGKRIPVTVLQGRAEGAEFEVVRKVQHPIAGKKYVALVIDIEVSEPPHARIPVHLMPQDADSVYHAYTTNTPWHYSGVETKHARSVEECCCEWN